MIRFLKSFYTYLVTERLGYRRQNRRTHVIDEDVRAEASERLDRLERNVQYLDANIDLVRIAKATQRQLS